MRSSTKLIALNGHMLLQIRQPEQRSSSTLALIGSSATSFCRILSSTRAEAAAPCATLDGISLGPCAQPTMNTPSVMVATGSSFGCFSVNQPSIEQEIPNNLPTSLAS